MAARPPVEEAAQREQFRESIAVALETTESRPELTARERMDLEARRNALRTDPVASGAGGIVMSLVATAVSIGLTVYLLKKAKETSTVPSMGRP